MRHAGNLTAGAFNRGRNASIAGRGMRHAGNLTAGAFNRGRNASIGATRSRRDFRGGGSSAVGSARVGMSDGGGLGGEVTGMAPAFGSDRAKKLRRGGRWLAGNRAAGNLSLSKSAVGESAVGKSLAGPWSNPITSTIGGRSSTTCAAAIGTADAGIERGVRPSSAVSGGPKSAVIERGTPPSPETGAAVPAVFLDLAITIRFHARGPRSRANRIPTRAQFRVLGTEVWT